MLSSDDKGSVANAMESRLRAYFEDNADDFWSEGWLAAGMTILDTTRHGDECSIDSGAAVAWLISGSDSPFGEHL